MEKILVLNPGSTSTKIAYFEDDKEIWKESISHSREELSVFDGICDQIDFRYSLILKAMETHGVSMTSLSAVASRGGPIAPLHSGAYEINEAMVDVIRNHPLDVHASLLGALIAFRISCDTGVKSFIYDAVSVNELLPACRITGIPELPKQALGHNLNMRAAALKICRENGWNYSEKNIIVAHLGGGITVSLHQSGRITDMVSDEDGPFAPERAGMFAVSPVLDLMDAGKIDSKGVRKYIKGSGGLVAWLGTNDSREVEQMIAEGNETAKLVYEAMALNVAKAIARLTPVCRGKVDRIVLTGGIAYSEYFTGLISSMVDWIAPVTILAGENEMQSLAEGILRVLRGEETARTFPDNE